MLADTGTNFRASRRHFISICNMLQQPQKAQRKGEKGIEEIILTMCDHQTSSRIHKYPLYSETATHIANNHHKLSCLLQEINCHARIAPEILSLSRVWSIRTQ